MKKSEVIVEFKTGKGEFLLVKINEAANFLKPTTGGRWAMRDDETKLYRLQGSVSELTEEQCKEVVDDCPVDKKTLYAKYPLWTDDWVDVGEWEDTAKESFATLLNSLEVYSKNPYGVVPPKLAYSQSPREQQHFDETINKDGIENWRKAEHRTGSWLLLKKN